MLKLRVSLYRVQISNDGKCGGITLHRRYQSSMLHRTLDTGGKFGPVQVAVVASWAGPQMPSVIEAWQQIETATTYCVKSTKLCTFIMLEQS